MRRIVLIVAWIGAGMAVAGFCLPWAMIDARGPRAQALGGLTKRLGRVVVQVRRGTETVTGELPNLSNLPQRVTGFQIPQLAHRDDAKVAMALMELFTNQRQHLGLKSYAVYAVPGIAVLCAVLLTLIGGRAPVALGVGVVCAAVAGAGFWKLLTTNTQTLFVAITIGPGLWGSLWGYVVLAVASVGLGVLRREHA